MSGRPNPTPPTSEALSPNTPVFCLLVKGILGGGKEWSPSFDAQPDLRAAFRQQQPPLLNVRQAWPNSLGISTRRPLDLNQQNFHSEFPELRPTGRFLEAVNNQVDGRSWAAHCWEIRSGLLSFLWKEFINSFSLQAMLTTIGQGVEHAVFTMQDFIQVRNSEPWVNTPSFTRADRRLPATAELVDCNLPSQESTLRMRRAIFGRRLIATLINFVNPEHWIAAVFDRAQATLYLYDSVDNGRDRRAKAAALAWRSFALNLGFPHDFYVVCPPMPEQPNGWACGYIALATLVFKVRMLQGTPYTAVMQSRPVSWLSVDGGPATRPGGSLPALQLPCPDWTIGAPSTQAGFLRAEAVIKSLMCNELGIRSADYLKSRIALRANHPGFQFINMFPGQPMQLLLPGSANWPRENLSRVFPAMYGNAGCVYVVGLGPKLMTGPPPSWPPVVTSQHQKVEQATGSRNWDEQCRVSVRCWDQSNAQYDPEEEARARQSSIVSLSSGST